VISEKLKDGLREVDGIEVTTIMDNYVDVLLRNSTGVTRPPLAISGKIPADTMLAEHGLSLLVAVNVGEKTRQILFDCGYSKVGVPHNLEMLGIELGKLEAIVLSHGHMDHTGALYPIAESLGRSIPLVLHPDAFLSPRYFGLEDGRKLTFPQTLSRHDMETRRIEVIERRNPSLVAEGTIGVTGEIERVTGFEKGLPNALVERNGTLEHDDILDDQSLVIKLKGKGLVVISGCGHAGIINTMLYAQKITGITTIHAVLGGFHLQGPAFEPIVERTIAEFKAIKPEVTVPMHCTGWAAIKRFSEEFPSSFVLNSVGTRISL
jgi:7,8-dihydropterin-6-yl-methyl-4-(beta-D-ribofuranosyl)aminobenzene 5'-phosphate synthase